MGAPRKLGFLARLPTLDLSEDSYCMLIIAGLISARDYYLPTPPRISGRGMT